MNKTYNVANIIFGTRPKYIELHKKLELLEALTNIANEKEADSIFYNVNMYKKYGENSDKVEIVPELRYSLIQNPKTLRGLIAYLEVQIFNYARPVIYKKGNVLKDKNGNYFLESENNKIYIENQQKYQEIIDEILKLDFLRKMKFGRIKVIPTNEKYINSGYFVGQFTRGIHVWSKIETDYNKPILPSLDYYPDSLVISCKRKINKDAVRKLLDIEVNASDLSDYQKDLIDNSDAINKQIYIDDTNANLAKFKIEEDDTSIHLIKKL